MQYGTIYQMSWITAQEDATVSVKIYDTENLIDDADSPITYDLVPTGNPCTISVINNDRKKWGIKAKQAKLEFYSVPGINAYNFTDSNDTRWVCEIKANDEEVIFLGFVVLTDISRPFLPDKQVITLTVSDGLGLLKEKPLTLDGGANPTGKYWIAYWLNLALKKTGLNLELFVHNNVRPYLNGVFLDESHHLYSDIYIDAKTFEKQIGESEDCYTVIEKLIDKDCFLTQYKGAWWIMRPDDFDGNDVYYARFNLSAALVSYDNVLTNTRNIGVGEVNQWVQASQGVEYERPYKFSKHTFKYDSPLETICNINYERGDLITTVSPTQKHYELDCWDQYSVGAGAGDPPTTDIYIRRTFLNDYETDRFIVFEQSASQNFILSEGVSAQRGDKFEVGLERRLSSDVGGSGLAREQHAQLRLYGDDGTYWTFQGEASDSRLAIWYECTSSFNTDQKYFVIEYDASDDQTQPVSLYSGKVAPLPVDGTVKFLILQSPAQGASKDTYISSIQFDYTPFISGTYQKFSGQSSKVSRDNYSANIDEDVSISDSPKPILKGGMFTYSEGDYSLHNEYFNATPFSNGSPPDTSYVHPFEYIRTFATFNQYRRGIRFFTGTIKGLGTSWPDLIHKYYLTDTDYDTNGRTFQLLSFEQNWKTGLWSAVLAECWHTDGKVYTDDFEFKYIE